jgi:hypothetical protein
VSRLRGSGYISTLGSLLPSGPSRPPTRPLRPLTETMNRNDDRNSDRNQPSLTGPVLPQPLNRVPSRQTAASMLFWIPPTHLGSPFREKGPLCPASLKSTKSQTLSNFRREKSDKEEFPVVPFHHITQHLMLHWRHAVITRSRHPPGCILKRHIAAAKEGIALRISSKPNRRGRQPWLLGRDEFLRHLYRETKASSDRAINIFYRPITHRILLAIAPRPASA